MTIYQDGDVIWSNRACCSSNSRFFVWDIPALQQFNYVVGNIAPEDSLHLGFVVVVELRFASCPIFLGFTWLFACI